METNARPRVLVLDDDLMFAVRIERMLAKAGYAPFVVNNREAALADARAQRPALTIINFGSERIVPAQAARDLKALPDPAPILGFISHTWIPQVRPNAMSAGVDLLVANSAIVKKLPQLVARLAPLSGEPPTVPNADEFADEEE